jgi:hypothetical protein
MIPVTQQRPTIGELLNLPERVNPSDFVLRLSEGVSDPAATIRSYVVTPQLAKCFEEALALTKGALESKQSRASYLHGSFGSGKSHFMAVLYLLLSGDPLARAIPELAEVVARHGGWTTGRKFLLVPYHMIGADSVEQRLLGGYVDHLTRLHPEKPPAGLYKSDSVIENARTLRRQMGDVSFFDALNRNSGNGGGWGSLGAAWDASRFDHAANAMPLDDERVQLVGDLAATVLTSARQNAELVSLDEGLSIISRHAQSLGYDAVILFLDELILWLASRAGSVDFVTREAPKLVKLVEAGVGARPVPIVSFVARQRDLRTVLGEQALGSEVKNFEDALNYFEARFDQIKLDDRNLNTIAQKRLLVPKDVAARELMDQAFESVKRLKDSIKDVLLTQEGDLEQFRQVYPFSLALVKTLVGVSSALQRERTALKIMVQLLVEQRNTLRLGEIVPVGDLFGVMLEGHDAFSTGMRQRFENARKLWEQKLKPLAEDTAGLKYEDAATLPSDDPRLRRLKENERIIGTLVLGALTPEVASLKSLTPRKLAALNHGSIQVAIPGTEAAAIWKKCQDWASRVGEIKINGEGVDATISLQLSGVDTSVIISNAAHEDNGGNRLRALKQLLFDELGLKGEAREYEFRWKATERSAELCFINVWEADDATLKPSSDGWQVVLDFPFDRDGRTPKDDIDRLNEFTARNPGAGVKTLVWLPSFFSLETQRELGRLVILDFLMANEQRLKDYSPHLSAVDRAEARTLLENQRTQLRGRLQKALRQAYGVMNAEPGILDPSHQLELSDQFRSLEGSLDLRAPTEATLGDALKAILAKALEHEFPGHPDFREDEVRITDGLVKRAFEKMSEALAAPELRILIDKETRRQLRPLLEPLGLAHVGDQWLLVERDWMDHFDRCEAQHSGPVTVGDLRRWIDWKAPGQPKPKGLPVSLQNLIIHTYCLQSNRLLVQQGLTLPPGHTPLRDEVLVEKQELPDQKSWTKAVDRAGKVFGVTGLPLASAQNMAKLAAEVRTVAGQHRTASENYLRRLRSVLDEAKLAGAKLARLVTAEAVDAALQRVESSQKPIELVRALVAMTVATSETAMGASLKQAQPMLNALNSLNLLMFEGLRQITDEPRATAARGLIEKLHEALAGDEYASQLGAILPVLQNRATELLVRNIPAPPPPPPIVVDEPTPVPPPPPLPPAPPKRKVVSTGQRAVKGRSGFATVVREIESEMDDSAEIQVSWQIVKEQSE